MKILKIIQKFSSNVESVSFIRWMKLPFFIKIRFCGHRSDFYVNKQKFRLRKFVPVQ